MNMNPDLINADNSVSYSGARRLNIFEKRIHCWHDTLNRSNQSEPPPPSVKTTHAANAEFPRKFPKTNVAFFDMDAIDCCLVHSPNALVLNLADDLFPGGDVKGGAGAQEEALFRRTNYYQTLRQELYPIRYGEAVYSPSVSVFKTSEQTGWAVDAAALKLCENTGRTVFDTEKVPHVSFVACPGIKYPDTVVVNGEVQLNPADVAHLKLQIQTIIQTAIRYNHETIVFGALGCGAWRCPSKHVAQIFKEVLPAYDGTVLNWYFAILNTSDENCRKSRNNGRATIEVFRDVFEL
jgi:hypothetical protein